MDLSLNQVPATTGKLWEVRIISLTLLYDVRSVVSGDHACSSFSVIRNVGNNDIFVQVYIFHNALD